jgi:predicted GTPase
MMYLSTTAEPAKTYNVKGGLLHAGLESLLPAFLVYDDDDDNQTQHAGPAVAEQSGMDAWQADSPVSADAADDAMHPQQRPPVATIVEADAGKQSLLRVGLIGMPNAGKSTIVNRLAGGTVSAASVRPETTRRPVLGALTIGDSQVWCCGAPAFRVALCTAEAPHR